VSSNAIPRGGGSRKEINGRRSEVWTPTAAPAARPHVARPTESFTRRARRYGQAA